MPYTDKDKERETTAERVRRYRALHQGVTDQPEGVTSEAKGVTEGVTLIPFPDTKKSNETALRQAFAILQHTDSPGCSFHSSPGIALQQWARDTALANQG